MGLTSLPVKFNIITDCFLVSNNSLTDTKGFPKWVGNIFDCSDNDIKSIDDIELEHCDYFYSDIIDMTGKELISYKRSKLIKNILKKD
jgi:hypothetical protein